MSSSNDKAIADWVAANSDNTAVLPMGRTITNDAGVVVNDPLIASNHLERNTSHVAALADAIGRVVPGNGEQFHVVAAEDQGGGTVDIEVNIPGVE